MQKNILLLVVISFFVCFSLPFFINICLPDGCVYNSQNPVCQDGNCINEGVISHLQERSSFMVAIIKGTVSLLYLLFFGVLLFLFFEKKAWLLEYRYKFRIILRCFILDYNSFIVIFARGILNPKIY